jgi:hypothetical protein
LQNHLLDFLFLLRVKFGRHVHRNVKVEVIKIHFSVPVQFDSFKFVEVELQVLNDGDEGFGLELVLFVEIVLSFELPNKLNVRVCEIVFFGMRDVVLGAEAEVAVVFDWLGQLGRVLDDE